MKNKTTLLMPLLLIGSFSFSCSNNNDSSTIFYTNFAKRTCKCGDKKCSSCIPVPFCEALSYKKDIKVSDDSSLYIDLYLAAVDNDSYDFSSDDEYEYMMEHLFKKIDITVTGSASLPKGVFPVDFSEYIDPNNRIDGNKKSVTKNDFAISQEIYLLDYIPEEYEGRLEISIHYDGFIRKISHEFVEAKIDAYYVRYSWDVARREDGKIKLSSFDTEIDYVHVKGA